MVKIICDTEKEKSDIKKLLRLGEFVVLGIETIMKTNVSCFNYRKIQWSVKKK